MSERGPANMPMLPTATRGLQPRYYAYKHSHCQSRFAVVMACDEVGTPRCNLRRACSPTGRGAETSWVIKKQNRRNDWIKPVDRQPVGKSSRKSNFGLAVAGR